MDDKEILLLLRLIQENSTYVNNVIQIVLQYVQRLRHYILQVLLIGNQSHFRLQDEQWVHRYIEYDFFQLFRMTQKSFNILLRKINGPEITKYYSGGGQPVPAYKQLLMTLWWLGKGDVLLSISERFNVAISTVFHCTETILERLIQLKDTYIVWPSGEEMITIENDFRAKSGYPGVIGAIDGTNILFKAPADQQDSYIDKKSNHSIKLQGIVTANKLFTNVNIGWPGSVHDARVFRNSGIYSDITNNNRGDHYFPREEYHLLGDKAYPLLRWLITPYKNNGRLTRRQIRHNTCHSKTRIAVEHVYGYLKGRWKILKYINVNSVAKAIKIIAACCVLHNFCYIYVDFWDEYVQEPEEEVDDEYGGENEEEAAINKRNEIALMLDQ